MATSMTAKTSSSQTNIVDIQTALERRLKLMQRLQTKARSVTLPLFTTQIDAENKSATGYDPVTQADIDCEALMREIIQSECPQDGIHGEEFEDVPGENDWLWTLDPIDGTRAFVAGVPVWSTLIAVSHKDRPLLGLIDLPALKQSFWGRPQKAWRADDDGTQTVLKTRACDGLDHIVLGCTEPLSMLSKVELERYNVIRQTARFSRLGLDAFGYALVAQGRMDVIVEAGLKPCDVRALMPVIEGAGGRLTNWSGGSPLDGGRVIASGDPSLLSELYEILAGA